MTFHFAPAVRERVSLIIALAAASGGGKTRSALGLARGLAGGDDNRVALIDTEAKRALHYAVAPGEQQSVDRFAFQHGELAAPFTPEAYADAIKAADDTGKFDVIVVDSCSHEYEGEGGLHEMHDTAVEAEVVRAQRFHNESWGPFDPQKARERASIGAWKEPKTRHKRFVNRLLQCRAHLILCLRAEEKLRMEQIVDDRGRKKTVITQPKDLPPSERWVPICEKRFMFEMTLSLVLTPANPGVPIPIKLQAQHRDAVPLDQTLSEETGRALAAWANGGKAAPARTVTGRASQGTAPALHPDGEPPSHTGAGADVLPEFTPETYIEHMRGMLEKATDADALAAVWNSNTHKEIRRVTFGPKHPKMPLLIAEVTAKINALRKVTA